MEEYKRVYKHICKNGLEATIEFVSNSTITKSFVFQKADYRLNGNYTLENWEDLVELGNEILHLNVQLRDKSTDKKQTKVDLFSLPNFDKENTQFSFTFKDKQELSYCCSGTHPLGKVNKKTLTYTPKYRWVKYDGVFYTMWNANCLSINESTHDIVHSVDVSVIPNFIGDIRDVSIACIVCEIEKKLWYIRGDNDKFE